jgi:cardiolipin synthase
MSVARLCRSRYAGTLIRYLPNIVSLLRLGLAPVIFRAIWLREYERALLWVLVAGLTDALDGMLARRLKAASRVGAYLDPIADKVLLSGIYFMLGYDRVIPMWVTAVVLGRDVLMLVFIGLVVVLTPVRSFPPTVWGKLSTLVQIVAAFLVLLNGVMYFGPNERWIRMGLYVATTATTAGSAVVYLRIGIGMLRARIDGAPARR